MRTLLIIGLLIAAPSVALAQNDRSVDPTPIATSASVSSAAQMPVARRGVPQPRCCNRTGALVGLTVGAVLGVVLVRAACDADDCLGSYIGAVAVLGGMGAAIGAVAPQHHAPAGFPVSRHVSLSAIGTRTSRGGAVSLRF